MPQRTLGYGKAYLFLTPSIVVIGGAELYMSGKSKWLQSRGWDVYIAGPCSAPPAFDYGNAHLIDIRLFDIRPFTLSKHKRRSAVEPIIDLLKQYEEVFVESSLVTYGFWGEYISTILHAEHMIFHLSECAPTLSRSERGFLVEKYERREFFCINNRILGAIIRQNVAGGGVLSAKMPDAVQNIDFDESRYPKRAYRIGCISRLDKTFIYNVVSQLIEIPYEIELVIVGGASRPNQNEKDLQKKIIEISKKSFPIYFTGALSPVPTRLVDTFDFGVGKAGGAMLLARHGVPTFVYSIDSDEPRGVLGFDYNHSPSSSDDEKISLISALRLQYETGCYTRKPYPLPIKQPDTDYSVHFDEFQRGHRAPISQMKKIRHGGLKEWTKGVACTVFGFRKYNSIRNIFKYR